MKTLLFRYSGNVSPQRVVVDEDTAARVQGDFLRFLDGAPGERAYVRVLDQRSPADRDAAENGSVVLVRLSALVSLRVSDYEG